MSAVGTIPDNEDKRPPDIIADKQIHRAATDPGTFAETPRPPLPQLPVVVPSNIEDFVRDVAVSTFKDLAKTITINGQNPEVSNQSVAFEIPVQPPASTQFVQMNPPPQTPAPAPQASPQPTGNIATLQEMEASSAARSATKSYGQRNDDEMDERTAAKIKADPNYKPSALASNEEKESYQRVTNPAANPSGFSPTQLTPQLQQQLVASVTLGAAGVNWLETKGTEGWDEGKNKPKFGEEKNRLSGETRSEQEYREEGEYRKQKKEYREKVDALEEERPGQRRGEGVRAYTERTNEDRLEAMSKEETAAVANGDSSYFYKGFIPILFTRADKKRKILARLDNTHSVVIEGAVGDERQGTLPEDNGYYLAGGGTVPPHPWQIILRAIPESEDYEYKIESASRLYTGYDSWGHISVSGLGDWQSAEVGYVILKGTVTDNNSELECTSAEITLENNLPDERVKFEGDVKVQTEFSVQLGYIYSVDGGWLHRQNMWQNLTLSQICVDGFPALYPI